MSCILQSSYKLQVCIFGFIKLYTDIKVHIIHYLGFAERFGTVPEISQERFGTVPDTSKTSELFRTI